MAYTAGMENDNVVSGLLRRRQEIADELEIVQGRVRNLVIDLDALDGRSGCSAPMPRSA